MARRVLVTGGAGYIGSVVSRRLLEHGYRVSVFDNLERGHRCNVPDDADLLIGDLRLADDIRQAMIAVKPDAVIHFAAYALVGESVANPLMYFENNVKGGLNLLAAMKAIGCRRLIFSSSCATYGIPPALPIEEDMPQHPTNPYGLSKLAFEQMCAWCPDLQTTFLRYFNAAGAVEPMVEDHEPETHIIPNVLKVAMGKKEYVEVYGKDYPTADGTCVRDYVHVDDLCSAHILALENGVCGAFNLGTGKGTSVQEVIDTCRLVTGCPIAVKVSPRRPGDPPTLFASGRRAREVLGWNPRRSEIRQIVEDAWAAHRHWPDGYLDKAKI